LGNIGLLYGSNVSNELIPFGPSSDEDKGIVKVHGYTSGAGHNGKKGILLLFINSEYWFLACHVIRSEIVDDRSTRRVYKIQKGYRGCLHYVSTERCFPLGLFEVSKYNLVAGLTSDTYQLRHQP
jgi:hypothetical protein